MEQLNQSEYQRKVVEMKKYLPSLVIIIERLKTMAGSAHKVLEMEQLHRVLLGNEPADSVKLDELSKYEETLMEIYNDSNDNEQTELSDSMENNNIFTKEGKTEEVQAINKDPNSVKTSMKNDAQNITKVTQNDTTSNTTESEVTNIESAQKITEKSLQNEAESEANIADQLQVSTKETIEHTSTKNRNSILKNNTEAVNAITTETTKDIDNIDEHTTSSQLTEHIQFNGDEMMELAETVANKSILEECSDPISSVCKKSAVLPTFPLIDPNIKDVNSTNSCEEQNIDDAATDNEIDADDVEYDDEECEENVELIKVPEETADEEMILPDSADGSEQLTRSSEDNKSDDAAEMNEKDETYQHEHAINDTEDAQHAPEIFNTDNAEETMNPLSTANQETEISASTEVTENQTQFSGTNSKQLCETAADSSDALNFGEKSTSLPEQDDISRVSSRNHTTDSNEESNINATGDDDNTASGDNNLQHEKDNDNDNAAAVADDNAIVFDDESTISVDNEHIAIIDANKTDNDDDVEIIETRESPICILSDDDENDNGVNREATKNPLETAAIVECTQNRLPRIFARKSTARPANRKTTQAVIQQNDVIELLDSSDDDDNGRNNGLMNKRKRKLSNNERETNERRFRHIQPKRTLLPANHKSWATCAKKKEICSSEPPSAQDCRTVSYRKKISPKSTPWPSTYKATPQSNFLNAVNLQPANAGENPPAFCATISNKSIIIPNAFYGNPNRAETAAVASSEAVKTRVSTAPPTVTTAATRVCSKAPVIPTHISAATASITSRLQQKHFPRLTTERRVYQRWLDNFLLQFTKPRQLATHLCFVLLQRVLKYKIFTRIKDMRTRLNTMAYSSVEHIDIRLYQELQEIFYRSRQLTDEGLRFCQAACAQNGGNNVTLTTDAHTGVVTSRTCTITELLKEDYLLKHDLLDVDRTGADNSQTNAERKRAAEDVEYIPAKQYGDITRGNTVGMRRKSLRKQRSRCYDERFFYEEADMLETTEEIERKQAEAAVQRKVEEKRLEAQRQREQQVKSFESAYIQMFSKTMKSSSLKSSDNKNAECANRNEPSPNTASIANDERGDSLDVLDDEPKQHRIYKVIPTKITAAPTFEEVAPAANNKPKPRGSSQLLPEVITCDDLEEDNCDSMSELVPMTSTTLTNHVDKYTPKNTNIHMHPLHTRADWCIICNARVPRTVDHYVNQHRNTEVYISRLPKARVERLRRNKGNVGQESFYKTGQPQYEAVCAFCNRTKRFMLPYWQQHFAMHTGEYAYRCSGCGIRKPTRSPLTSHVNQPCHKRGEVLQDYYYSAKVKQIEARICTLCNYTQLYRRNVLQHLRKQHNLKHIMPHHIETVVLLSTPQVPETAEQQQPPANSIQAYGNDNDEQDDGNESRQAPVSFDYDEYMEGQAGQWDETDATDDLSYMICGMLDVQMDEN